MPTDKDPPSEMAGGRVLSLLLVPAVALNAAGAMVVEIVAGRMLAPYFGMSLYTWTTVIGVVLSGLALGHWLGGRLAGAPGRDMMRMIGAAFWAGAVATILVLPITAVAASRLLQQGITPPVAITLSGFAAFFLPSLLSGLVQPLATTLALQSRGLLSGPVIGRMLAAGAFGSIVGTFLAGFFLISFLGSTGSLWLVAGLNAGLGALFVPGLSRLGLVTGAVVLGGALTLAVTRVAVPGFGTPCHYESQYYCIRIDPAAALTGRASRLMALDHLVHSINDEADPTWLFSPYVHLVDEVARHRFASRPFSAFFVGGGGFTLPRAWSAQKAGNTMVVAEIDPVVTKLAREQLWFQPTPRIQSVTEDARVALLRARKSRYDVIFGDAFHDIAIPAHLVTDEFHELVAARLVPGGFYALNLVDDPRRPRLLASLVKTLHLRFAAVEIWVSPEDVTGAHRATFILFASQEPSGLPDRLNASSGPPHAWVRIALDSIPTERLGILLTDDFAPVDRLLSGLWWSGD